MKKQKKVRSSKERVEIGNIADKKEAYREQTSAYKSGPTRVKKQPLTNKITRGARFGKVWFPYTKFPY